MFVCVKTKVKTTECVGPHVALGKVSNPGILYFANIVPRKETEINSCNNILSPLFTDNLIIVKCIKFITVIKQE